MIPIELDRIMIQESWSKRLVKRLVKSLVKPWE